MIPNKDHVDPTPNTPASGGQPAAQIWTAGTLRYTKAGLLMLFFWLMWNDFFLMLMEAVKPALTGLLMKRHGATNTEIALYMSTLSAIFTTWINPVVSTWSDRTRTRWGRRRPFLFFATIPAGIFLALIPFAPHIWERLMAMSWFASTIGASPINGAVLAIGVCSLFFAVFNAVLMAIFSYYFWDVVPESVLGRFNAIAKIVTTIKTFIWNYWIFGWAETHMEWIYVSLSISFVAVYLLSLYMVREGEYPPPTPLTKNGNMFGNIRAYFIECYSKPYFLWVFAGFAAFQLGNISNMYRLFHWNETLGMNLDTIGKIQAWPSLLIVVSGYWLGALVDKFHPIRMMSVTFFIWSLINLYAFFFLRGATSLLVFMLLITVIAFINGTCINVFTVEVFPREKIGQFCSANHMFHSAVSLVVTPFMGMLFDRLKDYTYVYAWSALFQALAALIFLKIYFNWKRVHAPLPAIPTPVAQAN